MEVELEVAESKVMTLTPVVQDETEGYTLTFPGWGSVFIPEHTADHMARFILFGRRGVAPTIEVEIDRGEDPDEDPIDASPIPEVVPEDTTTPVHVDAPRDTPPVPM